MTDMLDFFAEFWEDKLDREPNTVDNNSSKKGISYATNDYCGIDPVVYGLQTYSNENGIQVSTVRTTKSGGKRRTKAKNRKHYPTTN